jgi:hypothetical protein
MTDIAQKQAETQALLEKIEKLCSADTPQKALAAMTEDQIVAFLKEYYLSESLSYYDEVNKRSEESLLVLEKELESSSKPPYSDELVGSMINVAKMSIMEEVVEAFTQRTKDIKAVLGPLPITSPKAGINYQMQLSEIMQVFSTLLSKELDSECKSRGLDVQAFMKQAVPFLIADHSIIYELDSFAGLKKYESGKTVPVTEEQVLAFSKQTVAYSKLLMEGQVNEANLAVYPNLMNQYLEIKLGLDSFQVMGKIVEILKEEDLKKHMPLFKQLVEELYYVENGRALIFQIMQQQMEMVQAMTAQGIDPRMMAGMDPAMMEAMANGQMPQMDPAMMEAMMKGGMPPMDPGMLEEMMKNGMPPMDPGMMEMLMKGQMPPMNPEMMEALSQGGMPPFNPAMMGGMPPGGMPPFSPDMLADMTPENKEAIQKMVELGQKANQLPDDKKQALAEAMMSGDLEKMRELMPPEVTEMLDRLRKDAEDKQ